MKIRTFILAACVCLMAAGCTRNDDYKSKYDDLSGKVSNMEQRVSALETIVAALQEGDWITAVEPVSDGSRSGYKISFNNHPEIIVYSGTDGDSMFQSVTVGDDVVEFTLQDGTAFSIPRWASDHLQLPNGIIMLSDEFEDVLKTDRLTLSIIVNPSDYKVTKEDLSVLAFNEMYTKYEDLDDPFDETAHCDFTVVSCTQAGEYEGGYEVVVEVGGEGNFYNDAQIYLLFNATDHNGKTHSICSNTDVEVHVIPSIEEGLTPDFPVQSLYGLDLANCEKADVKPIIGGLWMSWYRNKDGDKRIYYDKSKVKSIKCSGEDMAANFTVVDTLFQKYGAVAIDIVKDSEFWTNAIGVMERGEALYTDTPEAGLLVQRGTEIKVLPISTRVYYNTIFKHEVTTTWEEIKAAGKKTSVDLSEDIANSGMDEAKKHSNCFSISDFNKEWSVHGELDYVSGTMELNFMIYTIREGVTPHYISGFHTRLKGETAEGGESSLSSSVDGITRQVPYVFAESVELNFTDL